MRIWREDKGRKCRGGAEECKLAVYFVVRDGFTFGRVGWMGGKRV